MRQHQGIKGIKQISEEGEGQKGRVLNEFLC